MSKVKIKPIGNRIVVKTAKAEEKTASGIIIPDTAKEKPQQGTVVAVSDEIKSIKIDNTVLYGRFAGTEVSVQGEEYLILDEGDVLAIV